ncbi:MAG: hypothetical protein R3E65_06345 [Steroidobacteraceae bacterium]
MTVATLAALLAGGIAFTGPTHAATADPVRQDPCRPDIGDEAQRLDRARAGMQRRVCATARWFDGLFGDPREHAEAYGDSYGRIGVAVSWDELDDAELQGSFRARLALPALGERVNAEIGRDDTENYIDDSYDDAAFLPGSFSDDRYAQWHAGLNYLASARPRSVFDLGLGLSLSSPVNPYLRARLRGFLAPRDDLLITLRSTAFWERRQGFGNTLGADFDWTASDALLLRFAQTATFSEATAGLRWRSRLSLYQALNPRSALRYEAFVQGETDGVQPEYRGVRLTYRRSVLREWLFAELSTRVFWADAVDPSRSCAGCVGVSAGFEVMFGTRYDRWLDESEAAR